MQSDHVVTLLRTSSGISSKMPRSSAQASITAWSRVPSDRLSRQTSKRDAKRLADDHATAEALFGQREGGVERERGRFLQAGAGFFEGGCLRSGARQLLDVADMPSGACSNTAASLSSMCATIVNLPLALDRCYARSTMHATAEQARDALYLYIDEAGNFDFGHNGTRHFVLAGVLMRRPFAHLAGLLDVKYDVLEEGLDLEYFHASEDRQAVRDRVFRCLAAHGSGMRMLCVVACKAELDRGLRTPERLYATAFDQLVREALNALAPTPGGQIIVVIDSLPVRSGGAAVRKAVRATLKAHTPTSVSFRILHHASRADVNLQVADYCAWPAYRRWEREDERSYRIIADAGVVWAESRLVQAG